ncbi:MAG: RagB/SusD family nutrient uptake outer membrane protein [Chitinophagaceae bacterium]
MKNIKKIVGLIMLLTFFTGCKKWVDFDPHDEYVITDADYLKSESDYQTMAVSCYTPIQWVNNGLNAYSDLMSDDVTVPGVGGTTDADSYDRFFFTTANGLGQIQWQVGYEGVNRVNYLFEHKDKNLAGETINFANKEALYGELHFLRAYYYFTLTQVFGDVVLFTDRKLGVADFKTLKRVPKAEVYKQVESDLNAAIAVLPTTTTATQKGRVTKYAAQALLGKVLLFQNKFDAAAAMLENVITSGAFSLVPNYADIFLLAGENGPESVFEIQYSNKSPYYNWNGGGPARGQGNYMVQNWGVPSITGTSAMPYAPGWGSFVMVPAIATIFEAGDYRKAGTYINFEEYKLANPALNVNHGGGTNLYNLKYHPMKGQTSGQIEFNWENNHRLIRYADVLLMAAEAFNRATAPNDAKAQGYLNQVRQRAFKDNLHNITLTGTALKQAIWNERRLEFAGEGLRYFDLIRTGEAASKLPGFIVGKHEVFPVPQREIDISGLTQNPNW